MLTSTQRMFGERGVSLGPFVKLSDPAVVEILGLAGFDHVVIDREHGPLSLASVENLVRAAELRGIVPFVRVPRNEASEILRVLDVGAAGVHIPHVSTADDAKRAVEACRFHPRGERGVCRFVRAAGYSSIPVADHFAGANLNTITVIQVEGVSGLGNLSDILAVPGVDVVLLGPYDLSQACGVPGEVHHVTVIERMRAAIREAREGGIVVGTFVESVDDARLWIEQGVQYVCYSVDVGILWSAAKEIRSKLPRR